MGTSRTKSVTVRLDMDLNGQLDRFCREAEMAKSLVVNSALASFLRNNDKARIDEITEYVIRAKKRK